MQFKHQVNGRTLLELVVAMGLGVLLALIMYTILIASAKTQRLLTAVSEISDRAQSIESFLKNYVTMAGFVEYPNDRTTVFGALEVLSGKDCAQGFNLTGAACDNNATLAQSSLLLRYQANSSNTFMNAAGDQVLDCIGNGQPRGAVIGSNFYVHNEQLYCHSATQQQPLFDGVKQMRVSYLSANSLPNSFQYASAMIPAPTVADWGQITGVRVCVLLRDLNQVAVTDGSIAAQVVDCDGAAVNSGNIRHARYQFTFAVRNNF